MPVKITPNMLKLSQKIINAIYPLKCLVCNETVLNSKESYLCKHCQEKIIFNRSFYRRAFNGNGKIYYDSIFSPFLYKGITKHVVHAIKYNKKSQLGICAGRLLAKYITKYKFIKNIDYIIPVPLHPSKLRKRGFNQSIILAKVISDLTKIKLLKNVLYRKKPTSPQPGLSKDQRFKNVKDAFIATNRYNISNARILLVDDIFTTGATAGECSKLLKNKGASYITVATLARG